MPIPPFAAIITASGSSERFNRGRDEKVKKEFLSIDGHTVLYRATEPFFEVPGLSMVVITHPKGAEDETAVALEDLMNIGTVPFIFVEGGDTRTESVRNALNAIRESMFPVEFVAIHDGARPFITPDMIIRTFAAATVVGGAAPATRITDAVKRLGENGLIEESVDKASLISVQTPQIFSKENLLEAYDESAGVTADDDISVYVDAGFPCTVVQGSPENRKITYFSDIPDAESQIESYIKAREEGRTSRRAVTRMRELMHERAEG